MFRMSSGETHLIRYHLCAINEKNGPPSKGYITCLNQPHVFWNGMELNWAEIVTQSLLSHLRKSHVSRLGAKIKKKNCNYRGFPPLFISPDYYNIQKIRFKKSVHPSSCCQTEVSGTISKSMDTWMQFGPFGFYLQHD